MSEYDNDALLEDIRQRGRLPSNDVDYTEATLLANATREMRDAVAPLLVQSRAEHLVYSYTVAATSGTAGYRMPTRAIGGGGLRDVVWIDSSGTAQPALQQISSDENAATNPGSGTPTAYYVRNYTVVLVPTPNVAGTVSMPYYARPNRLVSPDDCAVITSVSVVGTDYQFVAATPPAPLQAAGAEFDVIRATPSFETLIAGGLSFDGSDTFNIAVASVVEAPAVGDYVCVSGQAPVPQVPVELHGLLAARTARRVVSAAGDANARALLDADIAELESRAMDVISVRVSGDTQQAGGSIGSSGLVSGLWGWLG